MKIYELYSPDSQASYFLKISDTENNESSIDLIVTVQELIPHSQYRVTLIKTISYDFTSVVIHGSLLSMDNITNIAMNYLLNIEDITSNLVESND